MPASRDFIEVHIPMTKPSSAASNHGLARLRCAVYTRKSSEDGLEQDFNSLDAQREACAAFIASQKREGWMLLPEIYADGGFSGATMERPAFRRLLSDVSAGEIDVVVVYKVDRLTRSLSDFAKIVDILDKHVVSFVSVTQQFNTTTSMGRLTLNVLLSFAQFEREVTGERIRDKIAASKKKGMWMGGLPPLGYDVKNRKLVICPAEADTVQAIFRRYTELRSVRLLKSDLDTRQIVSKCRIASDGNQYGRKPLARGALYLMLQNRIYRGEIVHKDKSYPGEHEPIIDEQLWNNVQAILSENRIERERCPAAKHTSLFAGILFDAQGEGMSPTHANKKGMRYRYYVSRSLLDGSAKGSAKGQRLPATDLEDLVIRRIRDLLDDPAAILKFFESALLDATAQKRLLEHAKHLATTWSDLDADKIRTIFLANVARIQVHLDRIEILLRQEGLMQCMEGKRNHLNPTAQCHSEQEGHLIKLTISAHLRRAGKELRIIVKDGSEPVNPDAGLVRLLVRANIIRQRLLEDRSLTLEEIAKSEGVVPSYATRLFRLTLLAPDIVNTILNGGHPPELTARRLMDDTRLPLDWNEQRRSLGFASAP
jgi:site-specific DNA recombinase